VQQTLAVDTLTQDSHMNVSASLPPGLVVRDFFLSLLHRRRLILFIVAVVLAGSVQIALSIVPNYKARSTLLVLIGSEYALRPAAGQQLQAAANIDAEQVLRTEVNVLSSEDLHRAVIREIGVERLYPKLFKPQPAWRVWIKSTITEAMEWLGLQEEATSRNSGDPLAQASELFGRSLAIGVDRKSSVITLDFIHPDRELAAEVLSLLEDRYFALRQLLYGDVQAPIVQRQRDSVGNDLAKADATLEAFKRQHDISSFAERRLILMRQQGELETALWKAQSATAEQQAKVDQINAQLVAVVGSSKGATPNAASALQNMVEAYRRREGAVQNTYRGSTSADEAHRQMLERQTDVAKAQSTQAFALQTERDKAAAELRASQAAHAAVSKQVEGLRQQIVQLDSEESELHRLERSRGILEDNFKAVSKILDERQVIETIDANRKSSVRVIQPPRTPPYPQPTRRLILMAGVAVAILLAFGVAIVSQFLRTVYFLPEALELDTGLTVLAGIPDTRALGRARLLIEP
jgi:uncharacterized protein involved in exopolysaccharide biosynthesis